MDEDARFFLWLTPDGDAHAYDPALRGPAGAPVARWTARPLHGRWSVTATARYDRWVATLDWPPPGPGERGQAVLMMRDPALRAGRRR